MPSTVDDLIAEFLARGGQVRRVPEGQRPTRLDETPAERFFRRVNARPFSQRERETAARMGGR